MLNEVTQAQKANGSYVLSYVDPRFGFLYMCINMGASVYIKQETRKGSTKGEGTLDTSRGRAVEHI